MDSYKPSRKREAEKTTARLRRQRAESRDAVGSKATKAVSKPSSPKTWVPRNLHSDAGPGSEAIAKSGRSASRIKAPVPVPRPSIVKLLWPASKPGEKSSASPFRHLSDILNGGTGALAIGKEKKTDKRARILSGERAQAAAERSIADLPESMQRFATALVKVHGVTQELFAAGSPVVQRSTPGLVETNGKLGLRPFAAQMATRFSMMADATSSHAKGLKLDAFDLSMQEMVDFAESRSNSLEAACNELNLILSSPRPVGDIARKKWQRLTADAEKLHAVLFGALRELNRQKGPVQQMVEFATRARSEPGLSAALISGNAELASAIHSGDLDRVKNVLAKQSVKAAAVLSGKAAE
ncbi:MAG TPA: hypothetical protein VH328_09025 [Burkholderiaceae bacterium]|jgi:hypothetical protein|nr:hypothetical protein [Burkholderiaceae bacterium]